MDSFREYQKKAAITAEYARSLPDGVDPEVATFLYPSCKLSGEAGEVAEKMAKLVRDKGVCRFRDIRDEDRQALKKELGDVLWYVSEISTRLDLELRDVAGENIEKLKGRVARGTLLGDGDDR